jgi:hypothetical protein
VSQLLPGPIIGKLVCVTNPEEKADGGPCYGLKWLGHLELEDRTIP